jgi:CheY-like chemotaxis protein
MAAAAAAGAPTRALVVDDDERVRETVLAMLSTLGYEAEGVPVPSRALERAGMPGAEFDLLLVDVILPEMTGLQLARLLVERWPRLKVIYTSGYASASVMAPGAVVPAAAFLAKPFTTSELAHAAEDVAQLAA